jgi:hypothetical protein
MSFLADLPPALDKDAFRIMLEKEWEIFNENGSPQNHWREMILSFLAVLVKDINREYPIRNEPDLIFDNNEILFSRFSPEKAYEISL